MSNSSESRTSSSDMNQQQLNAYCAWVNSQLRKKSDSRNVEDLKSDMKDGVAFAYLIEIVASEKLSKVNEAPSNTTQMKENVQQVLEFMTARRIRMHKTTAEDIVEGNIKSIMRLILALAAHFKPNSVKQSSAANVDSPAAADSPAAPSPNTSVSGIAHGAATALAKARHDAAGSGQVLHRPKHLTQSQRYASGSDSSESHSFDASHHRNVHHNSSYPGNAPHHTSQQHLRHQTSVPHNQSHPGYQNAPGYQHNGAPHGAPLSLHSRSQSHHALGRYGGRNSVDDGDDLSASSASSCAGLEQRLSGAAPDGYQRVPGGSVGSASSYSSGASHDSPPTHRRLDFNQHAQSPSDPQGRYSNVPHRTSGATSGATTGAITKTRSHEDSLHARTSSSSRVPDTSHMTLETGHTVNVEAWNSLLGDHNDLVDELKQTKQTLVHLQKLLLNGASDDTDSAEESFVLHGSADEQENTVIMKSKLQQSEELSQTLREELSRCKNDCMQLHGTKAGLQQRLSDQEEVLMKLKSELLHDALSLESLKAQKEETKKHSLDKDHVISQLRAELSNRDCQIEDLVTNIQQQQQQKDIATRNLRMQIADLHQKLRHTTDTELSISAKIAAQDHAMSKLEGQMKRQNYGGSDGNLSHQNSSRSAHSSGDELQVVRDSIRHLRTSFQGNDHQHQNIDQLEQSISSLMDRLQLNEQTTRQNESRVNFDSTGDIRRSPINALHGFPVQELDNAPPDQPSTKILYFTDRTVTPFMCTIPKVLGKITLRDIKAIFDRQGANYRYHFKTMDPEFGTVKEEIIKSSDIIPGWEGKIVAWIEEDHD